MNESLDKLAQMGSDAVQSAIAAYVPYVVTGAIMDIIIASALVAGALYCFKLSRKKRPVTEELDVTAVNPGKVLLVIGVCLLLLASLILDSAVPDIFNPRAAAIHKLLNERAGK